MYIIRTAFWLSVVVLLIPGENTDTEQISAPNAQQSALSAGDAVNAALSTISDLAGLCARRPEVCDTGAAAWETLQRKALTGVDMIYRWSTGSDNAESEVTGGNAPQTQANALPAGGYMRVADNTDPINTGSTAEQPRNASEASPSQNTLRLDDLIPSWGSPATVNQATQEQA